MTVELSKRHRLALVILAVDDESTTSDANGVAVLSLESRHFFGMFVDELCAEEHFFYAAGYIDRRVWESWHRRMKVSLSIHAFRHSGKRTATQIRIMAFDHPSTRPLPNRAMQLTGSAGSCFCSCHPATSRSQAHNFRIDAHPVENTFCSEHSLCVRGRL